MTRTVAVGGEARETTLSICTITEGDIPTKRRGPESVLKNVVVSLRTPEHIPAHIHRPPNVDDLRTKVKRTSPRGSLVPVAQYCH
jgi:hypothetical protein